MRNRKTLFKISICLVIISSVCFCNACSKKTDEQYRPADSTAFDAMTDTWVVTDALGRTAFSGEKDNDKERFVGLFYWTWHTTHSKNVPTPVNVNEVVSSNPDATHDLDYEEWGTLGMPHHWNEPLYGYYDTDDEWVLRRHAELLAAAGVDVIIFDNTNGTYTFKQSYDALFKVFSEARADGVKTPQIAFLLPFSASDDANTQLRELYDDIYSQGKYSELWFYWKGKPLIMAYPDSLEKSLKKTDREICSFFTFRPAIPQYNVSDEDMKNTLYKKLTDKNVYWNWLSVYPQAVTYNADGTPEEMTLSVAQNWSEAEGLTAMNGEDVFGRTHTQNGVDTSENAVNKGANFAEQADYVLEVDPEFVFITGWNEWVAGRFEEWAGVVNAFPDEFNDEFSRDIEPTKGDLKDNYYYQLVDFIRRYKGTRAIDSDKTYRTINSTADWQTVPNIYYSYANNTFDRDDVGYGNIRYTDQSGRNDLILSKVASDQDNVYFYIKCANNISPYTDENWMRLLLKIDDGTNFEGYTHVINRVNPEIDKALCERSTGGWNWTSVGECDIVVLGSEMWLTVSKSMLGITTQKFTIDFKWTDNTLSNGDVMDFYLYGDTAPTGRFNYRYSFD